MADEELHETDSNDQKNLQAEASAESVETTDAAATDTAAADTTADATATDDEDFGVNMEEVQAVLNATADKATLTPQMQRMMSRQAENTKRVEETIKGTKSNPRWFVPLFCFFMIIGLIWCVVYYLSPSGSWPIPNIGAWNLAIGFALIMVGFLMTMGWR
ncbi:cell division protein CrgA [Bifidobacterium oedipodis]|uniref:Cell division protein CrgA n=1 Tax=Bifidobacterium oedipodis TaxID=2675322 RepID=A0A7Y0HS29_9BIFI|nr:cell division protein CrgA [Bifidobacterium sp. DSM 109957]NMM94725.1 septation inhibitor protein [Bifidobacterium sp. DSM 109957]